MEGTEPQKWLEEYISYYDKRYRAARAAYLYVKVAQIVIAAAIPVEAAIFPGSAKPAGILGAIVVILEGLQSSFQFQKYWIRYSSAYRLLVNEKHMHLVGAGLYRDLDAKELKLHLTEHVEALVNQEQTAWSEMTEAIGKSSSGATQKS